MTEIKWHRGRKSETDRVKYWIFSNKLSATLSYSSDFEDEMDVGIKNNARNIPVEDSHLTTIGYKSIMDKWDIKTFIYKVNEIIESWHPEWLRQTGKHN